MKKTFNHSYKHVFNKCLEALDELDMDVDSYDMNEGYIEASTSGSLFSWGEDIDITIEKMSKDKTVVLIESEASAQAFAWGKNSSNVKSIIERLTSKLKN